MTPTPARWSSYTFGATAVATQSGWLSVSPLSGATPANLQVAITPWNLLPGTTTGNIVVTFGSQTVTIPVIVNLSTGPSGYVPLGCQAQATNSTPFVSTLNATDGAIMANAALVPAGTNGAVTAYTTNLSHLILDINGYFQ